MQPNDETYILYGILFLFLFLGLLFNFSKILGSSKNFPPPKDKKDEWILMWKGLFQVLFPDDFFFFVFYMSDLAIPIFV